MLTDRNQAEVRCSTPNVDNQDEISGPNLFAPIRISFDPRVESGLRFLEYDRLGVTGQLCGMLCEISRGRINAGKVGIAVAVVLLLAGGVLAVRRGGAVV